ncbi:uncharacterized protein PHACADRAFT_108819 [Phanerochaete carnosa HHB-10118-sp]|uniref:RING-type domain-containing protein n=1 Tax=Phanerochaete carnosa (strain HHB-10118-sp) TaxID=650164 RepID=K5UGB2_PHACS|nr:uncharacterized protein PHACADRAFT_102539 [Phanerochaete carnosa HHB-10118-sp]XP_007401042.1 uncharacterized protein PHACADRAFT_104445 [Phanerochaete carnosa HHB-10118-sp]XP_007402932.1 uncharacterized protein PHACADRAFT_108819 [Phanerochaete carnosa HHB-10118-sp]EKM48516.1 hypothetical protein PHACADRAFT_108819 [Phanerochaete carnosa HHB-10118-sp]EKM50781.1 hypothetical protein PHACADRAFT_104445 [Phanerochaete carnosa HHB-10118-sp]EKM52157.1 hypothetical protein PHACADRAFT_102539 [Phaneroc
MGTARSATVDFYTPVTRIAVKALRTRRPGTDLELASEDIISAIAQENAWVAGQLLQHNQSPRPFWMDATGGSGTFVFAAYDNRDGTVSEGWCKKRLRVFGVEHSIQRHDTTPRVPLCDRCWHWEHTGGSCRAAKLFCSRCSLPHVDVDHARFCVHPDCQQARLDTLVVRTSCSHVYCASCDSVDHAPSSRECPYSRRAGDRDAKKWFSRHPAAFSAQDMRQRGKMYDGEVAVETEKQHRQAQAGVPEPDDDMSS